MFTFLDRFRSWRDRPAHAATIDTAKASPPPSPLAPVDLNNENQVVGVMDIAARIGDILLSSGTSNNDTKAYIHAVTSAYGLYWCHVDITLNNIMIFANIAPDDSAKKIPVTHFRVVRNLTTDFSKLSAVDRLIRSIQAGATPPDVAERILDEIEGTPPSTGPVMAILGWGVMGGAIAMMLGGTAAVGLIALLVSMAIMVTSSILDRHDLPLFFQNFVGGIIATIPAAFAYQWAANLGFDLRPSQIIASGIIVMMAGLTLVQSLQDGVTGAPVTASAHFFETLLYTGAVIGGVGAGIKLAALAGTELPPMESVAPPNFQSLSFRVIAAGIACAGFALASYAEWGAVILTGITGAAGSFFYNFLFLPFGLGAVAASALSAAIIGLTGGLLSRRFQVPPLIVAISSLTPMLPGLMTYRGMYAMLSDQMLVGFTNIAQALGIACGIAAGVVFGEWVARRVRRPKRFNAYRGLRRTRAHSFQPERPRTARGGGATALRRSHRPRPGGSHLYPTQEASRSRPEDGTDSPVDAPGSSDGAKDPAGPGDTPAGGERHAGQPRNTKGHDHSSGENPPAR